MDSESPMRKKSKIILAILAGLFATLILSFDGSAENDMPKLFVPKPPPSENLPCSKCHNYRHTDKKKRNLELYHTNIVLKHAEEQQWCFNCHEGDKLKLANGELIGYERSYNLCGQCHGTIIRDWKAGIHGKRTGRWNGEKLYRLCVSCHDPHQPKFKQIEPEKQPMRPTEIKLN
jgi:hypothetical protein